MTARSITCRPAAATESALEAGRRDLDDHYLAARRERLESLVELRQVLDPPVSVAVGGGNLRKVGRQDVDRGRLYADAGHERLDLAVALVVPEQDQEPGIDVTRHRQFAERE